MSQENPIRLFVTHSWEENDDYIRVFEYLESARNFFYKNHSTPDQPPSGDAEAVREDLRKQILPAEIVIVLASLYPRQQDLLFFQLRFAKTSKKPIVVLKHFGVQSSVPKALADAADDIVDWDERALVDTIRRLARHENTARWDVIEFKLD